MATDERPKTAEAVQRRWVTDALSDYCMEATWNTEGTELTLKIGRRGILITASCPKECCEDIMHGRPVIEAEML